MEYIDNISKKIWITRLCRIEASKRLDSNDSFTQALLIYYSAIITALSIWVFFIEKTSQNNESKASLILLISSIALTMYSTFIVSKAYKERAIKMKYNYIALDALSKDMNKLKADFQENFIEKDKLINEAAELDKKYLSLLQEAENHTGYDYLKAICDDKDVTMTKFCKVKYTYFKAKEIITMLICFIGPLFVIYTYIKW
ncbi:SLATT domain-containing protein [Pelosinus fermentans]|uniref:SMODS and SLOG-associating 2TM effector domain-containing protein n=1 Tax=Pelosinus fermentans JBW45 TaxID=1192197 RepID=I9NSD3_9FIRM|nr:SLATT domain-containing protein [Pelosinus fermentans]AJQ29353.1 hypothetical protein JBW_04016 [Pelosinus fermentans JBW45]